MNHEWIQQQFANVKMNDRRLKRRACAIAKACAKNPQASLPDRFENWAGVKAAYRFFSNGKASHQILQQPHYQNVLAEAQTSKETILFIQDTSELLFNSHLGTHGLGPTSDSTGNGLMFHSCLAARFFDSKEPEILGLGYQEAWVRPDKKKKDKTSNESHRWLRVLQKIGRPRKEWITVGDRGNDIYEFMHGAAEIGWQFVIRAQHDRKVEINGKIQRMFPWLRALTAKCQKKIHVRGNLGSSEELVLELSWKEAKLLPPIGKELSCIEKVTYIRIWCPEKPSIEWMLVTNLQIKNEMDVQRVVEIYRKRWLVEDYHKAVKSGFQLEANQMKHADRILALLGMIGVLATQLLAVREKCRLDPIGAVEDSIPSNWKSLVEGRLRSKGLKITIKTTREFWRCIAQMGGFLGRKSDGEPGWQTIWKGFMKLQDMLLGIAMYKETCG